MRTLLLATILLVTPAGAFAQGTDPAASIRNYVRLNDDYCTGGQPKPDEYKKLKAQGVRAVLNLRTPSEYRMEEEVQAVKDAGLKYFNIPVVFPDAQPEQAEAFLTITDSPSNRPLFVHCAAGVRVGAFMMIRRVLRDNWSVDQAFDEAKKIGLTNKRLEEFARKYIADHKPAGQ